MKTPFSNVSYKSINSSRLSFSQTLSQTHIFIPTEEIENTYTLPISYNRLTPKFSKNRLVKQFRETIDLIEVYDVYVHVGNYFFSNKTTHFDTCGCMTYSDWYSPKQFSNVTASYDLVVGIQHAHTQFGHFIFDHFALLFLLPKSLIHEATFLYLGGTTFQFEYLSLMGIRPNQVVNATFNDLFYAKRYYFFSPTPCQSEIAYLNRKLRSFLLDKFAEKENISPTRLVIYNREVEIRQIINSLEHLEAFQALLSADSVFEMVGDFSSIRETANFYQNVLLMFSIHGSVFPVALYLQPGTVYAEHQLWSFYTSGLSLAFSLGIHTLAGLDKSINRFVSPVILKLDLSIKIMEKALNLIF